MYYINSQHGIMKYFAQGIMKIKKNCFNNESAGRWKSLLFQ